MKKEKIRLQDLKLNKKLKIKGREKSETPDKRTERKEEEIPRFRRIRVAKDVINISCVAIEKEKETKKVKQIQ